LSPLAHKSTLFGIPNWHDPEGFRRGMNSLKKKVLMGRCDDAVHFSTHGTLTDRCKRPRRIGPDLRDLVEKSSPTEARLNAGATISVRPYFNTIGKKIVSCRTFAWARAVLSTTLLGSGLFPGRCGCRRNFPNIARQRDADRLEDATDVAGHWGAQEELLSLLLGFDLLQPAELANELAPLGFRGRAGEMLFQDLA